MLEFIMENWRKHGNIFQIPVGPRKMVVIIHPDHVRPVTLTNAQNYDKRESYDPVRKYVIGDGLVTSTGELWRRQRRLRPSSKAWRKTGFRCTLGTMRA